MGLQSPGQKIFMHKSSPYEWFLQELEVASVFAIKILIYIVWREQ